MDFETFEAIVADGGGYDNITCLVFDNSILVNFITKSEGKCKKIYNNLAVFIINELHNV